MLIIKGGVLDCGLIQMCSCQSGRPEQMAKAFRSSSQAHLASKSTFSSQAFPCTVSFIWLSLQHFCILHCNICASVTFMQIFVHLFILIFYYYIHDVIYASFTTNIHYLICIHTSSLFLYSTSSSGLAKLSIIA